jgi:hypothetical protein
MLDAHTTPSGRKMTTRWAKLPIPVYLPELRNNAQFKKNIEKALLEIIILHEILTRFSEYKFR